MGWTLSHGTRDAAVLTTLVAATGVFDRGEVLGHHHVVSVSVSLGPSIILHRINSRSDRYNIILNSLCLWGILRREIIACDEFSVDCNSFALVHDGSLISPSPHEVVPIYWDPT